MGLNILLAGLELFGVGTPHTLQGATKHTQTVNGIQRIDCSYLVYQAVASAGYGGVLPNNVGNFNTSTLSEYYAAAATDTTMFNRYTPAQVLSGSLQPGDILLLTNSNGGGHTGIFYGYDSKSGAPLFYNVGNAGSKVSTTAGYTIIGALRPQESQYNAETDITANDQLVSGAGLVIPTQPADPGLHYYEINTSTQTGRLYENGVQYIKDNQTGQEYWSGQKGSASHLVFQNHATSPTH